MDLINLKDWEGKPINFLATQVWPSARVAAYALEKYWDPSSFATICEFGCGPGLPSLAAAKFGAQKVIATDLDPLALQLVKKASTEQCLDHVVSTKRFDLTVKIDKDGGVIPEADLYLFSDVFESKHVAMGAAEVSNYILQNSDTARIWVFAQSDRACREDFLIAMRKHLGYDSLEWIPWDQYEPTGACRLHLFDLDETCVPYL
jgi:predicted nicotinamide N-methyase